MNIEKYIQITSVQIELLKLLFKDETPKLFVEIGACEGEDSIKYLNAFPKTKLVAVEALPDNIKKINRNMQTLWQDRFQLIEAAVTGFDGIRDFYISSGHPDGIEKSDSWDYGNKSSSLLKPSKLMKKFHKWLNFNKSIKVNGLSLATLFSSISDDYIDFVHMDVQGAEFEILKGGKSVLHKIRTLFIEVSDVEIYEKQPMANEVESFMIKNGFIKILDTINSGFGDHFYLNTNRFDFKLK